MRGNVQRSHRHGRRLAQAVPRAGTSSQLALLQRDIAGERVTAFTTNRVSSVANATRATLPAVALVTSGCHLVPGVTRSSLYWFAELNNFSDASHLHVIRAATHTD